MISKSFPCPADDGMFEFDSWKSRTGFTALNNLHFSHFTVFAALQKEKKPLLRWIRVDLVPISTFYKCISIEISSNAQKQTEKCPTVPMSVYPYTFVNEFWEKTVILDPLSLCWSILCGWNHILVPGSGHILPPSPPLTDDRHFWRGTFILAVLLCMEVRREGQEILKSIVLLFFFL